MCLKGYKHSSSLWKHKRFECGKKPMFTCRMEGCGFKSKRKDNLRAHEKTSHNFICKDNKKTVSCTFN